MDLVDSKKRKTEENGTATDSPPPTATAVAAAANHNLSADDIRRILQPFSRDQLLDLLQSATVRHADILESVRSVADSDTTARKLFVRGLSAETTTETLRSVFSAYGELEEAIVIMDKNTGRSKGYGFVTFKHVDGSILALKEPSKKIDGRMTVTQLAAAGLSGGSGGNSGQGVGTGSADVSARKIFVGNVPFDLSSERLLSHFSTYGEIEEGPLGFDKTSGKSKGFAFFVYKTEEGARAALAEPMKTVDGHQLQCKLALDNKKGKQGMPQNQTPTGFGGDGMPPHQPQQGGYPGSVMGPQYGASHGVLSSYGGYSGGHQGPPPMVGNHAYGMQSTYGSQVPSSLNANSAGYGGGYGGSQYGGPVPGEFGAKLPPGSGGYGDGSQYGYPSSAVPTQQQPVSQVPRVLPGGTYQGMPPYY